MLRYKVDLEDIIAFNQFWYSKSPVMRRQRCMRLAFAGIVYVIATIFTAWRMHSYGMAVFFALGFTALWLWDLNGTRKLNVKRIKEMYAKEKNLAVLGEHQLELTTDGLRASNAVSEGIVKFAGIEKIETTDSYAFIIIGSASGYSISRSKVSEGNLDEFIAELQVKLQTEQSGV